MVILKDLTKYKNTQLNTTAQVPTLFVHGFRGGDYTTEKMVLAALSHTGADDFLKITVDWRGELSYEGNWTTNPNPLIQIVFKDKWVGSRAMAVWILKVIKDLNKKYNFNYYNAVGHSLGAVALVFMEIKKSSRPFLPKLAKLVLIAGPFAGVVGINDLPNINSFNKYGRPLFVNPTYWQLMLTKKSFPKNVDVINIYGNVNDFSNTDKYVSVTSAKSISYILKDQVKSFQEFEIIGDRGEHSQMHDDEKILNAMTSFLFIKPFKI